MLTKNPRVFWLSRVFFLSLIMMSTLFSCAHKKNPEGLRAPSSTSYTEISKCGELQYSENSRNAVDSDDIFYNLKIDCNDDGRVNKYDEQRAISIPVNQLSPQQKAWVTRWKRQAVQQQKDSSAHPFVCVQILAVEDPCVSGKNVLGYSPKLTLKKSGQGQ